MVTPILTILLLGPVDIELAGTLALTNFRKILLPNIREDQTKSYYLSAEPLGLCHMVKPALDITARS